MNTQTVALKRRLIAQDRIDRLMNEVIPQLQKLVDDARVADERCELSTAQMSNLVNVATETNSVEVVIGYLQYQVGRDAGRRVQWAWNEFGERLVELIRGFKGRAAGVVDAAGPDAGPALAGREREDEVERVWMELTREALGHLRRYFIYRKRPRGGGGR